MPGERYLASAQAVTLAAPHFLPESAIPIPAALADARLPLAPHEWLKWLRGKEQLWLGLLAVAVGVLAAYGVIFLRYGIEWVSLFWTGERNWSDALSAIPWWIYLLAPMSAGLACGWINTRWLVLGQARVIPGVLEALSERRGHIDLRKTAGETANSIIAVGSGASMGREAPSVALGAALASQIGQRVGLNDKQLRTLMGCGVAAGIAASFNAPIAGVLFALEVILADYAIATFSPIVLAAVVATLISRTELGDFPVYTIPEFRMVSNWEIPLYILLGLFCGLIATAIVKAMPRARQLMARLVDDPFYRPAAAGLLLGLCALAIPQVMSIGYGTVDRMLLERYESNLFGMQIPLMPMLLLLLVAKAATSVLCSAGGFGGGMIGPSLFVGATAGALFGGIVHQWMPAYTEGYGAYALVASGALLAAAIQAPMSTIMTIFEMTGDYHILVPLMTACMVATLTKRAFGRASVITESLEERGIETEWERERAWLRSVSVTLIPRKPIPSVSRHARLLELKQIYVNSGSGCVQVVDENDELVGIVTFVDLQKWLLDESLDHVVFAEEVANRNVIALSEGDSLYDAINILDREIFEHMPVTARDNPRKVLGILSRNAVFSTYHKLIVKHGEHSMYSSH